jgi:DNA-binding transcriptional LysR family regulator
MTTEQLKYFVSIAENRNFSATAEEMNISQSAVSKQIRTFERELGCVLFDRDNRNVQLTDIGEKLYPSLKDILTQIETVIEEAHEYNTKVRQIKLISLPILGQYDITGALKDFESKNPDIQIQVFEKEEPDLIESLAKGEYDLAITRAEMLPANTYKTYKLASDKLSFFVNKRHPYAGHDQVTIEMLGDETFMFMPKHTYIYHLCMRLCKEHKITPNILSCARMETILSNVKENRCSTLLMARAVDVFQLDNIKAIPVEPECTSNIVAVYNEGGKIKDSAKSFLKFLIDHFAVND